jgi:putative aminopeptidase FrvX
MPANAERAATVERIGRELRVLMRIPGLSGYEGRVRAALAGQLRELGLATNTDRLGNLVATIEGDRSLPSVMFITHMDQLGFVVRKIEKDGFIRVERLGGVPERALAAQPVLLCVGEGRDVAGVIANKSHHATSPEEKYKVVPYQDIYVDTGYRSAAEVRAAGIDIGTPVVYLPNFIELSGSRIAGTSVDDRAGCAVQMELARRLVNDRARPTVHFIFSVQEEFNLRGAITAVNALKPDIAIQIDLILATDTPDMAQRGEVAMGGGPAIGLYSFHGRGTLNGTLPHPALVALLERTATRNAIPLQRSAHIGALTETSYVQLANDGVAVIDAGFPCRYSHSALEVCDLDDLAALADLLEHSVRAIDQNFSLDRDDYIG